MTYEIHVVDIYSLPWFHWSKHFIVYNGEAGKVLVELLVDHYWRLVDSSGHHRQAEQHAVSWSRLVAAIIQTGTKLSRVS